MASTHDLFIDAGATFEVQFRYKNPDLTAVDLSGFVAEFQVRRSSSSPSFALSVAPSVSASSGVVSVVLSAEQTSLLTANKYVYAVELRNSVSGVVLRLIEGSIFASPEVVR